MTSKNRRRASWLALLALLALGGGAHAQSHIGAERCKSCHEWEYKRWAAGPHARAHIPLTAEQRDDPKCNTCHAMLPEEADERFAGVQCERCHGPGRYYHRRYVMKDKELSRYVGLVDPKAEHCRQCHTEGTPSIRPFDFAEMWQRIDHGRVAREKWEQARAAATAKP